MSDLEELFFQESSSDSEPEENFADALGFHIRLAQKHHSLWGELIWYAGRIVGSAIQTKKAGIDVTGKSVVEFGSGSGLCTLCCATSGAKKVVCTDYPDEILLDNLKYNTQNYKNVSVIGHKWGTDVKELIDANEGEKFDIALMCDLAFNHVCHRQLLQSFSNCIKDTGYGLIAYSSHRPHLKDKDDNLITMAREEFGFKTEEIFTEKHPPMFENDPGDIEIRTTCHVYKLTK